MKELEKIIEAFENLRYFESPDEAEWGLTLAEADEAINKLKQISKSQITRQQAFDYITSLSVRDYAYFNSEVQRAKYEKERNDYHKRREQNRKSYQRSKITNREKGEKLLAEIEPGDIIKVRGTSDRVGLRKVIEKSDKGVTCIKLTRRFRPCSDSQLSPYVEQPYITTHQVDKIVKIIEKAK